MTLLVRISKTKQRPVEEVVKLFEMKLTSAVEDILLQFKIRMFVIIRKNKLI